MRVRLGSILLTVLLLGTLFQFSGCGTSEPEGGAQNDTPVAGVVVMGPVAGATVEIHALGADGRLGALVVDPILTDGDGSWNAVVPATITGQDFLVLAREGSYIDEATGSSVDFLTGQQLVGYFNRDRASSVVLSPFTRLLHDMSLKLIGDGVPAARSWALAIASLQAENSLGFDVTTTVPSATTTAGRDQKRYAAWLGGLSTLIAQEPQLAAFVGASPVDMTLALALDLADGALDGTDLDGNVLEVPLTPGSPVTAPLPLLDGQGVQPLNDFAGMYAANTPGLDDAEIARDMVIQIPSPNCSDLGCEDMDLLRRLAHESLENSLFAYLNGPDPDVPRDIDFSDTHCLYQTILECDPADLDASFALTVLDLATLAVDPAVNDAFDAWDAYLQDMVPFETGSPGVKLSLPRVIPDSRTAFDLPLQAVLGSMLPYLDLQHLSAPPQISTVQDVFRNQIIPRVVASITHLDLVLENPDFIFMISPRMQGDLLEEYREADYTDFMAMRAALKALEAGCRVAVSYDVSMPDYDAANLLASLQQNATGFLTLHLPDGQAQMQMVQGLLIGAAQDLDAAITALFVETDGPDPQDDDLIKIGPSDLDRAELEDFQATELVMIRESLTGPLTRSYDWDFDRYTPDVALTVDLGQFFNNPVQNWKQKLPPYSVSTRTVPYDTDYMWTDGYQTLTVTAPAPQYVHFDCQRYVVDYHNQYNYCSTETWLQPFVAGLFDDVLAGIEAMPDWSGEASIYANYSGNVVAGTQDLSVYVSTNYTLARHWVDIAVITWDADTYSQWVAEWPDPTLNGLFPQTTSAQEIADAFGMGAEEWSKEFELDWTE